MIFFVGEKGIDEPVRIFEAAAEEFPRLFEDMQDGNPRELHVLRIFTAEPGEVTELHDHYRTDHIREFWFHGERIRRDYHLGEEL